MMVTTVSYFLFPGGRSIGYLSSTEVLNLCSILLGLAIIFIWPIKISADDTSDGVAEESPQIPAWTTSETSFTTHIAYSAECCHPFRSESCHLIHAKAATHSRAKLPPVGAKRRGRWHCYSEGVVAVNLA